MSFHRICCCGGDCGTCPCSAQAYKVTWTGSFTVTDDGCTCRDWLGRRQGSRLATYTIADGVQRNLSMPISACRDGNGYFDQALIAFKRYFDNNCNETSCPVFSCDGNKALYYDLIKPTTPLCKWRLYVAMYDLGRVKSIGAAPFSQNTQVLMVYEAPYAGTCVAPGALTYVGAIYWDGSSAAVGDCLDYHAPSGLVYQGKISAIVAGTATIA